MPELPQSIVSPSPDLRPSKSDSGPLVRWSVGPLVLPIGLFSILWLDLIRLLSSQWEAREQYAYGWFVPIFALGLFWKRWLDRPGPEVRGQRSEVRGQRSEDGDRRSASRSPVVLWSLTLIAALALILLLPLRVIYEINRDWPLISWLYTLIVVGLTLRALHLAGGTPWVRHFAFPVALILVAVVWPYRLEKGLTQGLMRVVAGVTVELLGWMNIPALERGNLIDLGNYTVGIDEACSGIRSFQSSLMAGLVMGELYRMRLWWRVGLVGCGLAAAFTFNVARTLLLSWQASQNGPEALEKWHDAAGFTITVACFLFLWALAGAVSRWARSAERRAQSPLLNAPNPQLETPISHPPSVLRPLPSGAVPWSRSPAVLPRFLTVVGLWAVVSVGTTEAWYRTASTGGSGVFHWSVTLPEDKPGYQTIDLPPKTVKMLGYDIGKMAKWSGEDRSEWSVFFFRWQPRSIESVIQSRMHRPEVCLQASGYRQVSESQRAVFDADGLRLPFRSYVFEIERRPVHVFFCQWEDGAQDQVGMQVSKQGDRLESVLNRRRLVGQQTLEVIISGFEDAEEQLRKVLPMLIEREASAQSQ